MNFSRRDYTVAKGHRICRKIWWKVYWLWWY